MIDRIKIPGWILIFILIFLFIGGINKLVIADKTVLKNQDDIDQGEEIREEEVMSKYTNIHLENISKETNEFAYFISHPQTNSEQINAPIEKWIDEQKQMFLTEVEAQKVLSSNDIQANMNIQLDTNQVTDNYFSLVFRTYMHNGKSVNPNHVKVFNFDIDSEEFLSIEDILVLDDANLEKINSIIWNELQKNKDIEPYLNEQAFNQVIQSPENWEWSIDRKNFTLFWSEYILVSEATGEIEIEIPIEKMYVFLQKNVDSYLKMSKDQQIQKAQKIKQEQDIEELDPEGKYVALTFDDGPSEKVTPRILKTLEEFNAKATFFMLGAKVDYYPNLVRRIAEEGHEIGNHSRSHHDLSKMDEKKIKKEFDYTKEKIVEVTGLTTDLIRPPYGAHNDSVFHYAEKNGDSVILWSVDSLDWQFQSAASVNKIIKNNITPGAIVLMHDIHPTTADALPKLLQGLKEEGYDFITVSQLLNLNEQFGEGPHYGSSK